MPPVIVQMIDNGGNMKFTYKVKLMIVENYNQLGRYCTVIKWLTSRGHVLTMLTDIKITILINIQKLVSTYSVKSPKIISILNIQI